MRRGGTRSVRLSVLACALLLGTPWASSLADRLAQRAAADLHRLGHASGEWTAQLGLFCDPARVRELFDQFGGQAPFHILPSDHRGQACFRICWGQYGTAAEAKAARDLPQPLREIVPTPLPKPVDEVLE